jgi:hypothetical protein
VPARRDQVQSRAVQAAFALNEQAGGESLDREIERGDWTPLASWKFADDAAVLAQVQVGPPDAQGHHALPATWTAVGGEFKTWTDALKSKPDL